MAKVVPFKALRPKVQYIKSVASLPYDVVSWEEARQIAGANELSYLHVEKSEINLPYDIPAHHPSIYDAAKKNLERLIKKGALVQEKKDCLYVYAQGMGSFKQYGVVGCTSIAEYEQGKIKKHELTRSDKEMDRILHVDRVNAHTGPVFLTYRAQPAIDVLVAQAVKSAPEYDFVTDEGISHTVWIIEDGKEIAALVAEFAGVERLYIADGHHRAAAAAAVARMRREKGCGQGTGGHEDMLAVLFPHRELKIMDYNRAVKDLNGLSVAAFLDECVKNFQVTSDFDEKLPRHIHEFGMYLQGRWYKLVAKKGTFDQTDPIGRLDVSILQERLLKPVLAINDPRTDDRIGFVGGIRGMEELERLVDYGHYSVAFALYPVTIEQLMEVADTGMIMPPKSTWFEPKLRSGIFTHLLD